MSPLLTIINETNSTKFTCQVFGIPVPVVSWIRHREGFESEIIDGLGDPTITVSVSGYTVTSVLKFIEPLMNQEAIYECMGENNVTNVIGAAETVNVSLFVQGELTERIVCDYCIVSKEKTFVYNLQKELYVYIIFFRKC